VLCRCLDAAVDADDLCRLDLVERCCFFSSRRRHTSFKCDWISDVCSSDLAADTPPAAWLPNDELPARVSSPVEADVLLAAAAIALMLAFRGTCWPLRSTTWSNAIPSADSVSPFDLAFASVT